jgi:hypothetical protein
MKVNKKEELMPISLIILDNFPENLRFAKNELFEINLHLFN